MLKNCLTTLVFLAWTGIALSQNVPFPKDDAIWRESHITIAGPVFHHFALCGDTLIQGKIYSQMAELELDANNQVIGKSYYAAIRTEGDSVWTVPSGSTNEILLYDFSLEAEDQIQLLDLTFGSLLTRTVDSVKVENLAGQDRKVIYFKPGLPGETGEFWIEGFGSNYGVLWRAFFPGADIGFSLLCFQNGDDYLNLTLIECFLPEVSGCGSVNAAGEAPDEEPLRLTASPNPAGAGVKFFINKNVEPDASSLKIYAANGRLMHVVERVSGEMTLPDAGTLEPGFYFAVLEARRRGRVLAHCTFVVGK